MRRLKSQDAMTEVNAVIEEIIQQEYSEIVDDSFLRYATRVLWQRAIPDARDGLKPSQRRLLVAMNDLGLTPRGRTVKCAKVVGDCMGNLHPHGDAALYGTLVNGIQTWKMRYPLSRGQGGFGDMDGAPASAMRYTECALSAYGAEMLADLSPDVVPFVNNYDSTRKEPVYLPARLPNLLINGVQGIAVAVATHMPPHNLGEIIELIKLYAQKGDALTVAEMMEVVPGPDFPTGGVLKGQSGVLDYFSRGKGALVVEGVYEVVEGAKGDLIVVTELPYEASPVRLCEQIEDLVKEKKVEGIVSLKNLSKLNAEANTAICVEIGLSKNANVQLIVNQLLKQTCLRSSFNVNQTVLIDNQVVENTPMLSLVKSFLEHRKNVYTLKCKAEKIRLDARVHILSGLLGILPFLDEVIAAIRGADGREEALEALISKSYVQSRLQAVAVLALQLGQLTRLEATDLQKELAVHNTRLDWLNDLLANEKKLVKAILKDLDELAKKLASPRKTVIGEDMRGFVAEDLIPEERSVFSLTQDGYIKRIPLMAYRVQNRGGKGVIGVGKREGDEADTIFTGSTHDNLLFFTNSGKVYRKKGYEIPASQRTNKGTHLANVLKLEEGEYVAGMIPLRNLKEEGYIVMVTRKGLIKRTKISDFITKYTSKGLVAMSLKEGDEVSFVEITPGKQDIVIVTSLGKAIRYPESSVPVYGRASQGVKAISLRAGDSIAQMLTLDSSEEPDILVLTTEGYGKKSKSSVYRCYQGRCAVGINTIDQVKIDRNGIIVTALAVKDGDSILVMTAQGKIMQIPVAEIRCSGRSTMGVKVISLNAGDALKSAVTVRDGIAFSEEMETMVS